jgi:hypothetical protein
MKFDRKGGISGNYEHILVLKKQQKSGAEHSLAQEGWG